MWIDINDKQKAEFNRLATHPLQTYEWGEFRKQTGLQVIRRGFQQKGQLLEAFELTIHPIPHTPWTIGYLPKGVLPSKELVEELRRVGNEHHCIFIRLEPNMLCHSDKTQSADSGKTDCDQERMTQLGFTPAVHPLFTKYTLLLDLTQSEEELLKNMHPKARYNIKVAQKHNVAVKEEHTQKGFDIFWKLTVETTSRQHFLAHTKAYHQAQWQSLAHKVSPNTLSSHLLIAKYNNQPLTAWIVFVFHDTLYYPYGASSQEHRETMHSTAMMWEAIRFGKKHKLTSFDLWGATAPNTPSSDPWFGFTQFKERFGPKRVEFVGSYDLVMNPLLYQGYKLADKLRWMILKVGKR